MRLKCRARNDGKNCRAYRILEFFARLPCIEWMNEKTYISPLWMFYNVFMFHIKPILRQCFLWDCKENKNCCMFSGGSVAKHWPSVLPVWASTMQLNFYKNWTLDKNHIQLTSLKVWYISFSHCTLVWMAQGIINSNLAGVRWYPDYLQLFTNNNNKI